MRSFRRSPQIPLRIPLTQPYLGEPVGRNDLCPCKSGKKFKRCCMGAKARPVTLVPPEDVKRHQQELLSYRERRARHLETRGRVREPIHLDHRDQKLVVAGREVFISKPGRQWRTFHDFLTYYGRTKLGADWWAAETNRAEQDRHPLFALHSALQSLHFDSSHRDGDVEIFEATWNGGSAAFLTFAHDLYTVADNAEIQEVLLERLRLARSYQGARHELLAAATMIRAGFRIAFEDESDGSQKHPEFIAEHKGTGVRVAVEAKSRHRPGVLGFAGQPRVDADANMKGLFLKALDKEPQLPFVVFLDVNLPAMPSLLGTNLPAWIVGWEEELDSLRAEDWSRFNVVVCTSIPFHQTAPDLIARTKSTTVHKSPHARFPLSNELAGAICVAVELATTVPSEFPPLQQNAGLDDAQTPKRAPPP